MDKFQYISGWEGVESHLYLDTRGLVTIGVGCLVQGQGDCVRLPLVDRIQHQVASDLEKMNEYAVIVKKPPGLPAYQYSQWTHLELPPAAIRSLFDAKVHAFEVGLRMLFQDYDHLPDGPKLALLDMAFNLGLGGLSKFHRLGNAVKAHAWADAAIESHRSSVRDLRNMATADLFRQAAPAS